MGVEASWRWEGCMLWEVICDLWENGRWDRADGRSAVVGRRSGGEWVIRTKKLFHRHGWGGWYNGDVWDGAWGTSSRGWWYRCFCGGRYSGHRVGGIVVGNIDYP